ncbi:MAG: AraC family transcriptional regulator [Candidatus Promineifilaceae bacterium]
MTHSIPRPQIGGTFNGIRPNYFDYWRVSQAGEGIPQLDFWIEQAGEYHCKPHYNYPHFEYQIDRWVRVFYAVKGSAELIFNNRTVQLNEGDLAVVPSNKPFRYKASQTHHYHWFAIVGKWPSVWGATPRLQHFELGNDRDLIEQFVTIRELLILQPVSYQLQTLSAFYALLACIDRIRSQAQPPTHPNRYVTRSRYPDGVRNALIYLEEHCIEPYDVSATAKEACVSPSYLRALFDKWVGESPKRYHTRCRIEHAKHLFQTQHLPVQTVAGQVGYNDVSYFSRVFKQLTSYPPSEYCNQLANLGR